jgi:NAD(P)-dependent dehydrogenase (short-subunit alcohol dehydrogenase family)
VRELTGAAIVTGGASGLGAAVARGLHAAGLAVLVADVDERAGGALAASLGERGVFVPTDVTDPDAVAAAVRRAAGLDEHGLRLSVACAGIAPAERVLARDGAHSVDGFRHVVEVNLLGTFHLLRAAAEAMAANDPVDGERGVHVQTASAAAYEGQIGQLAYAASKAAIVGMTLPAARDLASAGIRVCAIAPGTFDTPVMAGLPARARDRIAATVPFPARLGRPEEFADLVLCIAANPMLNGETVRLDGALRLAPR